ncbi:MAG: FAD-dependent oxidoreductase [Rhodobacteraceae bacterium]|nr:FAD-dependent oxidoreductase [Paracoccaceae bacterium]
MNSQPSTLWTHLSSETNHTGTWRSALPLYQNQPSPCHGACPVGGSIATWIKQVKDGDHYEAWLTLVDNNPFPAIAGRICHHPCETACNRAEHDETVGICSLERFVGDLALREGWSFPSPDVELSQSVAVIGGGPAGLSAAYQLRRQGLQVTLFEAREALGGLMRYGIPSYRLSPDILDGEVARITAMGIDLRLNAEVMDEKALTALHKDFDAVFLATGASLPKELPGLDYSQSFVLDSAAFLADEPEAQSSQTGEHILVIGGGSAALDVARTARRLGRKVTVLTLESEGHLPAQQVELDEASEEGIEFITGAMMQSAVGKDGSVTVHATKVDFQIGNAPGGFTAAPVAGSEFTIEVNTIIPAIGQDADLARWNGILNTSGPVINISGAHGKTSQPGIFAGGDVASMSRFVTQAIGMGKEAALGIVATLVDDADVVAPSQEPEVLLDRINTAYHVNHGRNTQGLAEVASRLETFDEVQQPLAPAQAQSEAERCFSCGTCTLCDNCFYYCPDVAIIKLEDGYEIKTDYCKGCGLCVAECPTGSIHMQEDIAS